MTDQYSGFSLDFAYLKSKTPKPAESKLQKSKQKTNEMTQHLQDMEEEYKQIQDSYSGGFQDPSNIEREMELEEDIDTYRKKVTQEQLRDWSLTQTDFNARRIDFRKAEKARQRKEAQERKQYAKKQREQQIENEKRLKAEKKQKEKEERQRKREKKEAKKKREKDPREQKLRKAKKSKNIVEILKIVREDAKKEGASVISDTVRQGKGDGEMIMYQGKQYEVILDPEFNIFVLATADTGELDFYLDPTM